MSDRIAEIENRLNAATPGSWATNGMDAGHSKYEMNIWVESENGDFICDMDGLTRSDNEKANDDGSADSNFIAHAPSDVAYLLAELRKRDEALARVKALAERAESHGNLYLFVDDVTAAADMTGGDE